MLWFWDGADSNDSVHLCVLATGFITKAQEMFAELLSQDYFFSPIMDYWATHLRPVISSK